MKTLVLLIPCYNEEARFKTNEIKNFIIDHQFIDFYFVNDGSTDGTADFILMNFANSENCFLISYSHNSGKGKAIRRAILQLRDSDYLYYGFIDADFEIPFPQVLNLLEEIKKGNLLMAISSRNFRQNFRINRLRSYLSFAMMRIANQVIDFQPGLKDTQCGNKIFRKEIIEICFYDEFISEWLFDIEIFLRLKKEFPNIRDRIVEVPLIALGRNSGNSNFRIRKNLKILKQLRLIRKYYVQ